MPYGFAVTIKWYLHGRCVLVYNTDMSGFIFFNRTYLWFDEKGKKVKVAAPQYVDYVMTFIQKTINDESVFPTKSGKLYAIITTH